MLSVNELREAMQGATAIDEKIMNHIYAERWLQIWVPEAYGGLGCDFKTGLTKLYNWAKIDGSLGWMLTLCSGANYFARNMIPAIAKQLFSQERTCFGGSGMVGGTADEQQDGTYIVNGLWHYATGAPYLSHFTLNAHVLKQGIPVLDNEGNPRIHSFVIPQDQVVVIPNWKSMGMKATGTYSFQVNQVVIPSDYHFVYDTFYTQDTITRIPFRVFADLTLLVNYIGLADHFVEEALKGHNLKGKEAENQLETALATTLQYATQVENILEEEQPISQEMEADIHAFGVELVEQLTLLITQIYVQLGIKGTQVDQPIHQIFCDFFTATQHANFR